MVAHPWEVKHKNGQFETSLSYTTSLSPAWTTRPLRKQEQNHEVFCEPVPFFVSFIHSPETSRNHLPPCDICSLRILHSDQVNHLPSSGVITSQLQRQPRKCLYQKHFLLGFQELFGNMFREEKKISVNKFLLCILGWTYKSSPTQNVNKEMLKAWSSVVMRFLEY